MIFNPAAIHRPFSVSFPLCFPRKFNGHVPLKPSLNHWKCFSRKLSRLGLACYAYDEVPNHDTRGNLKGMEFLHWMEDRGVRANCQTYHWLMDACINFGSLIDCKKLHGKILKLGFDKDSVLCYKLIDIYLAKFDFDGVVKVFEDMPERSVHIWNKILSGLLAEKRENRVLELFLKMLDENVNPNEFIFASVLRASGDSDVRLPFVEQIHARIIRHGFATNPVVCNPLIDSYAKNGFINSARKVFDELSFKDSVSWVAMISGFSQNGFEEEVIQLFCQMHVSRILPTPYVFSSVLSACTKIMLFDTGEQLHALVFKWGFSSETYVCNALVTLYSRLGDFISAELIFGKMQCKDEISYNSLISGLSQQSLSVKALQLFEKMQLDCLKPDCVTVASLFKCLCSNRSFM